MQLFKYHEMSFIYNYSNFYYLFCNQPENVNKLWNNDRTVNRAFERTKSKQKQNQVRSHWSWPRVILFDLAHKRCNGIIKGWLLCLTSEWKGRLLVSNIQLVFGSAWRQAMAQIQFSLIKKIKIGRPEHSLHSLSLALRKLRRRLSFVSLSSFFRSNAFIWKFDL